MGTDTRHTLPGVPVPRLPATLEPHQQAQEQGNPQQEGIAVCRDKLVDQ